MCHNVLCGPPHRYLDFINLMTYDLNGAWENFVGHNSPLFSRQAESDNLKTRNVVSG